MIVGEKGATFLISSQGTEAILSLKSYYTLPLPDGSEIGISSAVFQIQITPEYYSLGLEQSGSTITSIDVTSADPVDLRIDHIFRDGTSTRSQDPIALDIFDDVDGSLVYSGSTFRSSIGHLPIALTKRV